MSEMRVLIVDDNADCADSTADLLQFWGFAVQVARDGQTGLAAAIEHKPDVLLLDIGLPQLDGYELAKRLDETAWLKKPFVIAITGFERDSDQQRAKDAGIHVHMTKPVDPQSLLALLRRFERIVG